MRRLGGASVAVVLTAMAVAGCSSNTTTTSGTTSAPPTTAAPGSTETAKAPGSTAAKTTTTKGSSGSTAAGPDQAKAQGVLLAASDLPGSWTAGTASPPKQSVNQVFLASPDCKSLTKTPDAAVAASPQQQVIFSESGQDTEIQNEVDVYPSSADAGVLTEVLGNPEFGSCLQGALQSTSGNTSATVSNVQVSDLSMPSASDLGVDSAAARQATVTVTQSGHPTNLALQVYAMQKGNALVTLTVTGPTTGSAGAPSVDLSSAVQTSAKKLSSAF